MNKLFALNEVTQAMKQAKKRRMYERYQALYLHLKGKSVKEIAETLNRSAETVKNYIQAYETGGLAALQMKYSPGAPVHLFQKRMQQLRMIQFMDEIMKSPDSIIDRLCIRF
ncbi:helix-turn-helix domain-containing protein [Paenibacillus larvae]